MPDQIESLFAGLRAETLPQVRPPGIAAVHRTVRRRRTARSVAGATAVLAAAGAFAAMGLPEHDQRKAPDDRMARLTAAAQRAVGEQVPDRGGHAAAGPVTGGTVENVPGLTAGSYIVAVACAGAGVLTLAVTRSDGENPMALGGQVVSCATDPQAATMPFQLPVDGELTVSLHGDDQAAREAAYSLVVARAGAADQSAPVDPESSWNAGRAAQVLSSGGHFQPERMTTERPAQTTQAVRQAGEYEFRMACAGPGSVVVRLQQLAVRDGRISDAGGVLSDEVVSCTDVDPRAADGSTTVVLPKNATLAVTVTPDEAARNRAGFAYYLDPV
ncbi:hypothetical protein AB0368_34545 [Actinoplanes sp. NPDC051475]|uniref:hypothetical protein n=1 Tax=Actinoplanes sp. NPDC051475 TaxID=3157225 RepID=UPI00344ED438